MLFPLHRRDEILLSRRSRAFIRVHHLAIATFAAWMAYLFITSELI